MDEFPSRIHFEAWEGPEVKELPAPPKPKGGRHMSGSKNPFWRNYMILIVGAALFTLYSVLLCWRTDVKATKRETAKREAVQQQLVECQEKLKAYEDKEKETARQYFLSGDASREAFINQEIESVAPVIAKLSNDAQKKTEIGCFIARHKNPDFPNSFKELAEQPQQWPLYDGKDRTYSQHDRDLAEAMIRPYLESGIIPSGLTQDMVYASWSQNDLVLRDSWESKTTMNTWRAQ